MVDVQAAWANPMNHATQAIAKPMPKRRSASFERIIARLEPASRTPAVPSSERQDEDAAERERRTEGVEQAAQRLDAALLLRKHPRVEPVVELVVLAHVLTLPLFD